MLLAGCLSGPAVAHDVIPEAPCVEPVRPAREDVARWNAFVDDVDGFRACINAFVESQYSAADVHRLAAERAATRWNDFVRTHLNVPEDFPHRSSR